MSGKRQPTEVVKANGRKHMSRAEEDARRDQEVYVPVPECVTPPKWLAKRFHAEFVELGETLRLAGLFTNLDRDALGQFLQCRERWIKADKLAAAAIKNTDEKLAKEWTSIQSTYFKQCRQSAEVLGLSITSRCRLVVPPAMQNAARADDEVDEFTKALQARQAKAAGG